MITTMEHTMVKMNAEEDELSILHAVCWVKRNEFRAGSVLTMLLNCVILVLDEMFSEALFSDGWRNIVWTAGPIIVHNIKFWFGSIVQEI